MYYTLLLYGAYRTGINKRHKKDKELSRATDTDLRGF